MASVMLPALSAHTDESVAGRRGLLGGLPYACLAHSRLVVTRIGEGRERTSLGVERLRVVAS